MPLRWRFVLHGVDETSTVADVEEGLSQKSNRFDIGLNATYVILPVEGDSLSLRTFLDGQIVELSCGVATPPPPGFCCGRGWFIQ